MDRNGLWSQIRCWNIWILLGKWNCLFITWVLRVGMSAGWRWGLGSTLLLFVPYLSYYPSSCLFYSCGAPLQESPCTSNNWRLYLKVSFQLFCGASHQRAKKRKCLIRLPPIIHSYNMILHWNSKICNILED